MTAGNFINFKKTVNNFINFQKTVGNFRNFHKTVGNFINLQKTVGNFINFSICIFAGDLCPKQARMTRPIEPHLFARSLDPKENRIFLASPRENNKSKIYR